MPPVIKSDWGSGPGDPRVYRRIVFGALAIIGLCALCILIVRIGDHWFRSRMAPRVEAAIHVAYPDLCAAPGDRLLVDLSDSPRSLIVYRYWDVRCASDSWMSSPVMIVDAQHCTAHVPPLPGNKWYEQYRGLYHDGDHLSECP